MVAMADGLFVFDTVKKMFEPYSTLWPAYFSMTYYMGEDAGTGRYWLTTDKGLVIYDSKNRHFYDAKANPEAMECFKNKDAAGAKHILYLDKNRILWLYLWADGKGNVTFRYDIKKNKLTQLKNNDQFWGFLTDHKGNTWSCGAAFGRYIDSLQRFVEIPKKRYSLYGIDFNEALHMYEDDENNIWLLSDFGLYNFNLQRQYFTTVTFSGLRNGTNLWTGDINGFVETDDGHIIVLSWGGEGLNFFNSYFSQVNRLYGYNPVPYTKRYRKDDYFLLAWSGIRDSKGIIWIGCQAGHILRINPLTEQTDTLIPPQFNDRTIRSITEDADGNIWFGCHGSIIVKWERASGRFIQVVNEKSTKQPLAWVLVLLPDGNRGLWAGTSSGGMLHLDILTGKIIEQFVHDDAKTESLGDNFVRAVSPLNTDSLAIATSKGIDIFSISKKAFTHITENDGLPGSGIITLIAGTKNNLWFTTADGISKIHLPDKRIHEYGPADGLTEKGFQFGASKLLKDGRIVFGNARGFIYFNPDRIDDASIPSDVLITDIRIFDKSLSVDSLFQSGDKIRLEHFQNYITIHFASLRNMVHNRPVYYYMLEGINKKWVSTQKAEAVYSYLPPGTYTFKVKCVSTDGIESKGITSFTITIRAPFYLRWWFILLCTGAIGIVLYYIYLLRLRRRNERELIRNRIARDLHDDMGSVLSTINILSTMTKTKIADDPVKASEYAGKISDNSQRMMEAMDDIVWAIKPDNDNMQKIKARMREFATNILEAKDIELDFEADEKINEVKLNMEARRDFFLIFKEAVNNVAKYAHCSKCSIHIGLHKNRLMLDVKDNGVGFDVTSADSGNGLSNMHKRAAALKGRVTVLSKPGEGTQVTLNLPAS